MTFCLCLEDERPFAALYFVLIALICNDVKHLKSAVPQLASRTDCQTPRVGGRESQCARRPRLGANPATKKTIAAAESDWNGAEKRKKSQSESERRARNATITCDSSTPDHLPYLRKNTANPDNFSFKSKLKLKGKKIP